MKNAFLIGEKIFLRAFAEGDEEMVARSENHPDPRQTLYYALPSTKLMQSEKLEKKSKDFHTVAFIICEKEKGQPIGITSFERIDWVGRMTTFYIAIADKENWSKGYGKEATQMMVEYAFATLNLNRVQLHVSVDNPRAVKAYQSAGFEIEGTLRQAMYFDNQYHDFYLMAVLREDWERR